MRYIDQRLDDTSTIDGDTFFRNLNTRIDSESLKPGEIQEAVNIRLDDNKVAVRKGITKINDDIALSGAPLVLPIDLGDSPVVQDVYVDGAYGSGLFHDHATGLEWVVVATADEAFLWREDETTVDIDYPTGETCDDTDTVHIEQANDVVYLFRGYDDTGVVDGTCVWDAITADEWVASTAYYVDEVIQSTANDYVLVCTTAGTSNGSEPSWSAGTAKADGTAVWTAYPLAAWAATTAYDSAYDASDPTFRTIDSGITIIRCTTAGTSGATEPDMKDRPVLSWDGNTANNFVAVSQKRPTAATHRALTAAPYSLWYRNRLTKPVDSYSFNVSGILTPEDFDAVQNEFKINAGSADSLVGFSPFQDDNLIVFYRKSIHLMTDFSGTLANIAAREVIRGVGCVARRTIVSAGDNVYWLGDRGIYSLNIVDQLNLKGVEEPLSRDIDDFIESINMDAISTAHSIYFNNRLYFAVPAFGDMRPNRVAVYNILNGGWESIDEYPVYVDGFQVVDYDSKKRLLMVNKESAIHVMEDNTSYDVYGSAGDNTYTESEITGQFRTRHYNSGVDGISRFTRAIFRSAFEFAGEYSVNAFLTDPDYSYDLVTVTETGAEDQMTRRRIGKRGYGIDFTFTLSSGRPTIKSVVVERHSKYRTGDYE